MTRHARDPFASLLPAGADIGPARAVRRRRHVSFRRRNRKRPYTITLNLTAMIDTIFNLLFLFIMISRFGALEGMLPADLPGREVTAAASLGAEVPRMPIRISLLPDPTDPGGCRAMVEHFNPDPIALRLLPAALRKIRTGGNGFDASTPVHLLARDDVAWDHVVNAYNAAMAAEFTKIYFAGSP